MPIYKGTAEVTSGNFYKGSTEIQDGYKATDPFYVNETTLTIIFVDNTATGSSLNSTSSAVFTGVPGSTFSSFSRSVNRTNGTYKVTGASVSESGDSGGNVNTSVSGSGNVSRNISISGTIPTTIKTITLTVNSTVGNLLSRNMSSSGGTGTSSWGTWSNTTVSWSGGGTASAVSPGVADSSSRFDYGGTDTGQSSCGGAQYASGMNSGQGLDMQAANGCSGSPASFRDKYIVVSVSETSTYQAGSIALTGFRWQ